MDALTFACWGLAGLALFQALLTLLQTWEHRRFHRTRLAAEIPLSDRPRVMLFVPCKGRELGLDAHLEAFFRQDYTNYEICFVVEADDDPAMPVIEAARRRFAHVPSHLVVAGLAGASGQKVHNLIAATSQYTGEFDVFAFADSDARPVPGWLATLVGRMAVTRPIVTGYRWMVPEQPTLANRLVAAISNQLAGVAGPRISNLVWGGSWAIRTDAFCKLGLPEAWRGTLVDDLTVSRLARAAGMKVIYEPRCLVPSPVDTSLPRVFEFVRRQYLLARVCTPGWWWLALLAAGINTLVYAGSAVLAVAAAAAGGPWWIPAAAGAGYYAASVLKSMVRWRSVRPFVCTSRLPGGTAGLTPAVCETGPARQAGPAKPGSVTDRQFRMATAFETFAGPLVAAVTLAALLAAATSRRLTWRGITYYPKSATETVILRRERASVSSRPTTPVEPPRAQRAA